MIIKTALVTGASEGIGASFCTILIENGWKVIGVSRNKKKLELFKKKLKLNKHMFEFYQCDVQDIEQLKLIANENKAPVLLFLNAGIYNPINSVEKNIDKYKNHINVNYIGVINCYESFLPKMIKNKSGHIIIMSSISGWIGLPRAAAYGPTKAALRSFAQSIRYDLNPKGISVQICSPGFVETSATSVNDFYMPGLMKVDDAAKIIFKNMNSKKFEFSFPFTFSIFMKVLSIIPDKISSFLIKKMTV